ncbi:hypothetical protein [Accumulibacter sp.]|uniref:hypothetical protein n=1 Tax=Accumulibacter sp. TaxID=2053492 RepID=UPI0026259085|nr:hypothetical protein [Accumulibacter sp.]
MPEIVLEAVAQDEMTAFLAIEADAGEIVCNTIVDHRNAIDRVHRRVGHQTDGAVNDFVSLNQRGAAFL